MADINFFTTVKGSLLEGFYPRGWNFKQIDACCAMGPAKLLKPSRWWSPEFQPLAVKNVAEMDERMGNAIADEIISSRKRRQPLAIILPVGPMGMYQHVVRRLLQTQTPCDHVTTFNMDEWADRRGNSFPGNKVGGFEHAMKVALFNPLGKFTVPPSQRNFAVKNNLPTYADKIAAIKRAGGRLVTVYGIGRTCHIAFWEPQIAGEMSLSKWKKQTHRVGVALHPLTVEQNALHSYNSRFTLIPCYANTIGPGLFLQSDYCIGGADGVYPDRGAMWQGMSLCMTLKYKPSPWVTSSWMTTLPGRLFFCRELAGPLLPDAH
jgi:glucosamine-6-phosphate deaminase